MTCDPMFRGKDTGLVYFAFLCSISFLSCCDILQFAVINDCIVYISSFVQFTVWTSLYKNGILTAKITSVEYCCHLPTLMNNNECYFLINQQTSETIKLFEIIL